MISILLFTIEIVAPIFLLILIGTLFKKTSLVNDTFIRQSSNFVFNISLPALVFVKLSTIKINESFDVRLISTSVVLIIFLFLISWGVSKFLTKTPEDQGSFIQGSFRSNFAIVGLAMIMAMLGETNVGKAAMLLSFIMPLYNILAVISLTIPFHSKRKSNWGEVLKDILTNPLILAAIVALPFSIFQWNVWEPIYITLDHLAAIALPLALIGIGATLNLERIMKASTLAFTSSFLKLIVFPMMAIIVGIMLEFSKVNLGIFFILFATPTAIASFVMAEAMKCNSKLAGDIIAISTALSIISMTVGLVILKYLEYI